MIDENELAIRLANLHMKSDGEGLFVMRKVRSIISELVKETEEKAQKTLSSRSAGTAKFVADNSYIYFEVKKCGLELNIFQESDGCSASTTKLLDKYQVIALIEYLRMALPELENNEQ